MSFLLLYTFLVYYSVLVMVIGLVLEKYRSKCQFSEISQRQNRSNSDKRNKKTIAIAPSTEKQKKVKVTQSCPTLCDPMDYTVHGILQARILEWVAYPFYRGSSQPREQNQVSHVAGRFFTSQPTRRNKKRTSNTNLLNH